MLHQRRQEQVGYIAITAMFPGTELGNDGCSFVLPWIGHVKVGVQHTLEHGNIRFEVDEALGNPSSSVEGRQ